MASRLASIVRRFIAGGAIMLPLLASGHGSEFLDAKFYFDDCGIAHLHITADYGGNPMISSEQEARTVLTDALRIAVGAHEYKLTDLAPLQFQPRDQPDPESPAPRGPEDPQTQHQLLTAQWQWRPSATTLQFFVPRANSQTALFWMREVNVHPPRWSMLIPGDYTPAIPVPTQPSQPAWLALLFVPLAAGVWWWRTSSNHSRISTD